MQRTILALTLSGLAQMALGAGDGDYTRWLKVEKLQPDVWRATCHNEIRNLDPRAAYQTRSYIQPPYFSASIPEGSGTVSRQSPRVVQSGRFTPTGQEWEYVATLKGRVLQQRMSFTFTPGIDFDVADSGYVLCDLIVMNLNTGASLPVGRLLYYPR